MTVALTQYRYTPGVAGSDLHRKSDLRRILDERGLTGARVVPVSATTGREWLSWPPIRQDEAARVSRHPGAGRPSQAARLVRDAVGVEARFVALKPREWARSGVAADLVGVPIIAEAVSLRTLRAGTRIGWLAAAALGRAPKG